MDETPFVTITSGEPEPWLHLDNSCPTCGEPDLPLLESDPPGISYIKHCGGMWLRGPLHMGQ